MYRIFIVEDDRTIAQAVAHLAESWGLEVRCVRDFRAVTAEAAEFQPHLIILDIALPCFDGYHWCRELRKQTSAPILFLSSAGDNMNVIMAMNFGADDFIAKPFDGGVLMAKVQAMLRRSYDMAAPAVLRERRGAQLSADDQKLTYQGQTVELTKNEYRILSCLMESAGKVVSREKLMHRQRRSRRHIPWTRYCGRCTAERRRQTARRRLPRRYTAARGCWNGCWTTRRSWRPIWTR